MDQLFKINTSATACPFGTSGCLTIHTLGPGLLQAHEPCRIKVEPCPMPLVEFDNTALIWPEKKNNQKYIVKSDESGIVSVTVKDKERKMELDRKAELTEKEICRLIEATVRELHDKSLYYYQGFSKEKIYEIKGLTEQLDNECKMLLAIKGRE